MGLRFQLSIKEKGGENMAESPSGIAQLLSKIVDVAEYIIEESEHQEERR